MVVSKVGHRLPQFQPIFHDWIDWIDWVDLSTRLINPHLVIHPLVALFFPLKYRGKAKHWFHVAECFIGRRSQFKEHFAGMAGTDVYIKVRMPSSLQGGSSFEGNRANPYT